MTSRCWCCLNWLCDLILGACIALVAVWVLSITLWATL